MAARVSAELTTAVLGWLLTGGVVTAGVVRRRREGLDQAATVVAHREVVSFRELMERARAEQEADPATALFLARYRDARLAGRWPVLARLARNGELTSRPVAG
jgi:hypothetical protein